MVLGKHDKHNGSKDFVDFATSWRTYADSQKRQGAAILSVILLLALCRTLFLNTGYSTALSLSTTVSFEHLGSHCADVSPITASEFHKRQNNLARVLYSLNASAYIAEPGPNTLYFANISDSSWQLSERPFLLIISPSLTTKGDVEANVMILTPKFEASRARLLPLPSSNITYLEWAEDEDPYEVAVSGVSFHAGDAIFLSESSRLFIRDGIQAAAPKVEVVSAPLPVRSLRERKSAAEVALLRCVNEVTLLALRAVREKMHLGISDSTTKKLIISALTSAGLQNPFALVLFGKDAALPHGAGTDRILRKEDFILFDIGGTLHGYHSDVTRTFALDESVIPYDHLNIWHTVSIAQLMAFATAARGVPTHVVDDVARGVLVIAGYGPYFTHRLGHGIGLEGHESPYLRGGSQDIIQTGHTFSDEPGVYMEGKVGVRLEDCFVVTESGLAEYLTGQVGGPALDPWHP